MATAGPGSSASRSLLSAFLLVFALTGLSLAQRFVSGPAPAAPIRGFTPGIPASVTSQGSIGAAVGDPNFPPCCINPLFPLSSVPLNHHRNRFDGFFPVPVYYGGYYGGYGNTPVVVVQQNDRAPDYDDEDGGGPTIFDRRGPRQHPRDEYGREYSRDSRSHQRDRYDDEADRREDRMDSSTLEAHAKAPEPVAPAIQPKTVLIFRDGHQEEIQNYAIMGDHLFDFGETRRKIELASLDLPATAKANDARGLDFALPAKH